MKAIVRDLAAFALGVICPLAVSTKLNAQYCSVCTKSGIDMPISLAIGTVRTPEFFVKHKTYAIDIRSQWLLPTHELQCKMGFTLVPSDPASNTCREGPLIELEWRVLDGDRLVAHGSDRGWSNAFEAGAKDLSRYIGHFTGEAKHKYVVEVRFSKDGSALNVTNPRLIIATPGFSF